MGRGRRRTGCASASSRRVGRPRWSNSRLWAPRRALLTLGLLAPAARAEDQPAADETADGGGGDEDDEGDYPDALPEGWARYIHAESGRPYFGLVGSSETTWTRPGAAPLPQPWEEHWDANLRKYFYYNPSTAESTWERPSDS